MWFILLLFEALPELVSAQGKSQLSVPAVSSDQRSWRGLEFFNSGFMQFASLRTFVLIVEHGS